MARYKHAVCAAALCLVCAGPVTGETAQEAAFAAAQQLSDATVALQQTEGARDRVKALTEVIDAFEAGLAAMRNGVRSAALREQAIRRDLEARNEELAALLAVMQTLGAAQGPQVLLHPSGALGTARAGMMVGDISPALQAQAAALRAQLDELRDLRVLQEDATTRMQAGLEGVQAARTALSQAISQRTDRPRRFVEDPVRMAILLDSAETLEAFASGLIEEGEEWALPEGEALKGTLSLPVRGALLRDFNDADAAGIVRPGWLIATEPRAKVTTPTAATVRYLGPFLDYGNVIILEPAADTLLVLAGMGQVFGSVGQILQEGDVVGLMGGTDANLNDLTQVGGVSRSETLYIEIRQFEEPVDPNDWFAR
nr:peptidoglycan DD-metalloendopeptidase family protein [Nereida sp. MMG025]